MIEIIKIKAEKKAKKDYEAYKKGEITPQKLAAHCEFSKLCAAWGDEIAQEWGYHYLKEMERLGFIKNLHRED